MRRSINTYRHNYRKGLADPIPYDRVYQDGAYGSIGPNPLSHRQSLLCVISVRTEVILAEYTFQPGMGAATMTCNYDVLQVSRVCNCLQGNRMQIVLLS
jgi:hypothetical protein